MHSIFVHLTDVSRDDISDYLDAHAVRGLREHWYHPDRSDPIFTVRYPHGDSDFRDEENRTHVVEALGREPDLTVQFDAGAKHPGHKELRAFLIKLLTKYSGVALDDLSSELDRNHQGRVLRRLLASGAQVFITGTEPPSVLAQLDASPRVFHVEHGVVTAAGIA